VRLSVSVSTLWIISSADGPYAIPLAMNPRVVFVPVRSSLSGMVADLAEPLHDVPDPLLGLGRDSGRIGDAQDHRRGGR
jgi:hypothetical protein